MRSYRVTLTACKPSLSSSPQPFRLFRPFLLSLLPPLPLPRLPSMAHNQPTAHNRVGQQGTTRTCRISLADQERQEATRTVSL